MSPISTEQHASPSVASSTSKLMAANSVASATYKLMVLLREPCVCVLSVASAGWQRRRFALLNLSLGSISRAIMARWAARSVARMAPFVAGSSSELYVLWGILRLATDAFTRLLICIRICTGTVIF